MFLRATTRKKMARCTAIGASWRIVACPMAACCNGTCSISGEINSSQERAWRKSVEVFEERAEQSRSLSLFPEDRIDESVVDESVVRLCLSRLPCVASVGKRRYGYSRDHRSDRVRVVIALVVTPEDLPLTYDVLPGNTDTAQRRVIFSIELNASTARLEECGSWIVLSRRSKRSHRCAAPTRRCTTWSARPMAACRVWKMTFCSSPGWRLIELQVHDQSPHFTCRLSRDKLKQVRRSEGRYLLRTNLTGSDPAELWRYYIQLTQVEEAFENLKGDLAIRPIYHQNEPRIEAHTSSLSWPTVCTSR